MIVKLLMLSVAYVEPGNPSCGDDFGYCLLKVLKSSTISAKHKYDYSVLAIKQNVIVKLNEHHIKRNSSIPATKLLSLLS